MAVICNLCHRWKIEKEVPNPEELERSLINEVVTGQRAVTIYKP